MKKKGLFLIIAIFLFAILLVACGGKTYTVSFVTNCETSVDPVSVKNITEVELPNLTKEGYELEDWYTDASFTNRLINNTELKSDITLYAKWTKLKFKVKFMVNDKVYNEQEIEYAANASQPENPTLEGHNFAGWDKEFTNVKSDLTVNATFDIIEYTVKFMDGSREIASVKVEYGKDATEPSDLSKTGYTFVSWDKEFTNVKSDLIINATYKANEYNVSYYDGETSLNLSPAKVTYGVKEQLPTYEKAGAVFVGWYDSTDYSNKILDLSKLTEDTKLYAKYYTIKLYDGSNEITNLEGVSIENDVLIIPDYEVSGYKFIGWFKDNKFTQPLEEMYEVTGDVNLYALLVKVVDKNESSSWINLEWGTNDAAKGIDPISDLPEHFERDFYAWLKNEGLLEADALGVDMKAPSWKVFSGINPNHSGDPKRIWNDCTNNKAQEDSDGYMALYLFESLEVDTDTRELKDIIGGFLGTEPYKTKYFTLMQHLVLLYDGKYLPKNYSVDEFGDSNSARELYAFLLDGYFYGTQGLLKDNSVFDAARKVIPTVNTYYLWDGSEVNSNDRQYDANNNISALENLFKATYNDAEFDYFYTDEACSTKLSASSITNRMTVYFKCN